MKTLALIVILALHVTGLWPHVSQDTQNRLISRSADTVAPAAAAGAPALSPIDLPVRLAATPLDLDAAGAIAIDRDTATVLYAKNPDAKRPIASVTKLVTALVILSAHDPADTITIPTLPKYPVEAETMGLVAGDTFKLTDIAEAALVPSANDAADALAISEAGSVDAFAAKMNAKMTEWGIAGTHFSGASGLQDAGNYATAAALAKIANLALANPTLAKIVKYSSISITSSQGRVYNLKSTNDLLASGGFYGIKTGYTLLAGECFVGLTRVNGHEVITVVLGSSNRFGTTATLTNWIGRTWQWL
jgi:D-alanyl-D-alanine carboxypeptidase